MAGYRPPYTIKEDIAIIRYIIDQKAYYRVKGKVFWQEMESAEITRRTWQSLKEHYIKKIYENLSNPAYNLDDEEIRLLRAGFSTNTSTTSTFSKSKTNSVQESEREKRSFDLADMLDSDDE